MKKQIATEEQVEKFREHKENLSDMLDEISRLCTVELTPINIGFELGQIYATLSRELDKLEVSIDELDGIENN